MFDFKVTPDTGDAYKLTAGSRDVLVWEKTNRGKTFAGLSKNLAMVDLYALAHVAARRQGMFAGTLQEFEEQHDLDVEDDGEPDPTRTAP